MDFWQPAAYMVLFVHVRFNNFGKKEKQTIQAT